MFRRKGFGVHSPRAYDFITTTLFPGKEYAFYGYELIDHTPMSRLLWRVLIRLHPGKYYLSPELNQRFEELCQLALPVAVRVSEPNESELIITGIEPEESPQVPVICMAKIPKVFKGCQAFILKEMTIILPAESEKSYRLS